MTRKHFELIAQTITRITNVSERKRMAELNAAALKKANPRFKRQKFMEACNVV